jgi:hypothetical protein
MKAWERGLPSVRTDAGFGKHYHSSFALQVRVKALHHWIRKGEADKAARAAREAAHTVNTLSRHGVSA